MLKVSVEQNVICLKSQQENATWIDEPSKVLKILINFQPSKKITPTQASKNCNENEFCKNVRNRRKKNKVEKQSLEIGVIARTSFLCKTFYNGNTKIWMF